MSKAILIMKKCFINSISAAEIHKLTVLRFDIALVRIDVTCSLNLRMTSLNKSVIKIASNVIDNLMSFSFFTFFLKLP